MEDSSDRTRRPNNIELDVEKLEPELWKLYTYEQRACALQSLRRRSSQVMSDPITASRKCRAPNPASFLTPRAKIDFAVECD